MSDHDDLYIAAGKRLAVERIDPSLMDDWYVGVSPRNGRDADAEGTWCHWVHLARQILAHDLTREQMPDHYRPYPNPPSVYSEHHPDCTTRGPT